MRERERQRERERERDSEMIRKSTTSKVEKSTSMPGIKPGTTVFVSKLATPKPPPLNLIHGVHSLSGICQSIYGSTELFECPN